MLVCRDSRRDAGATVEWWTKFKVAHYRPARCLYPKALFLLELWIQSHSVHPRSN
jgi:hypothetical protein